MAYLDTYSGNWTAQQARHLLKRVTFGVEATLVNKSVSMGLAASIDALFNEIELPAPPLKYQPDGNGNGEVNDPDVSFGQTWVNAPVLPNLPTNQEINRVLNARKRSLYAWSFLQMQNAGFSIREKLTLFWHNHFVSVNQLAHREYVYMNTLRKNAMGNFKQLVKEITVDTNMLLYLSGNENTRQAPNENYARELLELFTIGKGEAVGNGDYTNYTEKDIEEIAKVLTGWRVRGPAHELALTSVFVPSQHTLGTKQLSHRFNNAIIQENGSEEYKDLIEVIFLQSECSRFICRKLYRWFINAEISDDIELNIIEPLAKIIRDHDYDIAPALKILLRSDHFYETTFCMIKSPIDLIFSTTKSLSFSVDESLALKTQYDYALFLSSVAGDLNQALFQHPDVAGWKAYYQEPLYYKSWINSFLIPKRLDFSRVLITGGYLTVNGFSYGISPLIPVLAYVSTIPEAQDPNKLIEYLANEMFNYEISATQKIAIKDVLIPGLPDFEWTLEYSDYLANPEDAMIRASVEKKLRDVFAVMVQMSEFQIM